MTLLTARRDQAASNIDPRLPQPVITIIANAECKSTYHLAVGHGGG